MKSEPALDMMLAYMNSKYSDTFEYLSPFGGGPGASSIQAVFACREFPEAQIWVECYEQDGEVRFADNYVDHKFEAQTRQALEAVLSCAFGQGACLSFSVGTKAASFGFDDSTPFSEYAASALSNIWFNAVVQCPEGDIDCGGIEGDLLACLKDKGILANGNVYFSPGEDTFRALEELSARQRHSLKRLSFAMSGFGGFDSLVWR